MTSATENPRRLFVSGIAYSTSDVNFKCYFQQFGDMEHAEIVRDRQGRSKGYGFVSYLNTNSVERVLQNMHILDGRKIEIRLDGRDTNKKRIFVARIPPEVTEMDFRNYFQLFGQVQDAYMPKDHTKQSYRGIGFVTFDNPDTVDYVVRQKHQLGGAFIAVDRAIVANENVVVPNATFYAPSSNQVALDLSSLNATNSLLGGFQQDPRSILNGPPSMPISPHSTLQSPPHTPNLNNTYLNNVIDAHNQFSYVNNQPFINQIPTSPIDQYVQSNTFSINSMLEAIQQPALMSTSPDIVSPVTSPVQGQEQGQGQMQGLGAIGYRIFIGKLTRDTNEQDVREYFQRYGFILDVYLPKNKENRQEHRGFGFVTFETYTSVQRVASDGDHRIKGATIVIDVALPRQEEVVDISAAAAAAAAAAAVQSPAWPDSIMGHGI